MSQDLIILKAPNNTLATEPKQDTIIDNQTNGDQVTKITDGVDDASIVTNTDDDTDLQGENGLVVNGVLYGRVSGSMIKPVRIDANTHSLTTVEYSHHERHDGRNFDTYFDEDGTSLIIAFRVEPDQSRQPHMELKWRAEETATITWYKGATWTSGTGSAYTPVNSNDNSANTSVLQGDSTGSFISNSMVQDPSGLSLGGATIIMKESVWATNQSPASNGEGKRNEHILEPGETYAIVLASGNGGQWIHTDHYEHIPKD